MNTADLLFSTFIMRFIGPNSCVDTRYSEVLLF